VASLHDLLEPLVMAATTRDTAESVDGDAEAEIIQRNAEDRPRRILGLPVMSISLLPRRNPVKRRGPVRTH
jgi:hypothetical protein